MTSPESASANAPSALSGGQSVLEEIAAERRRQIEQEGWTPEHDDQHRGGTLDECECGDYRRDHPFDGPCNFNSDDSRGPNGGLSHGFRLCPHFRLQTAHQSDGTGKGVGDAVA